jgi:hypothetical protein
MLRTLLAAAAFLGSAVAAQAATVSFSQTFSGPATLSFEGFDASLGTLTGVTATFDVAATIEAGGLNARNGATARYRGTIDGTVSIASLPQLSTTSAITGPLATCAANTNLDGNCRANFGAGSASILFAPIVTDLSAFSSAFDVVIGFATTVNTLTGSLRGQLNRSWTGTGTVTLTYAYEPPAPPAVLPEPSVASLPAVVPLPAGAALLLGGLGVLGALGLRRRRRA